jgi:hypothetical protein
MTRREPEDKSWPHGFCDVCGWYASHIYYGGGRKCCEHHIERGGIPADWHDDCMKHYAEKRKREPVA